MTGFDIFAIAVVLLVILTLFAGVKTVPQGSFAMRDTFLISPAGKIVKFWEVKDIQGHSEEVLAAIAGMNGNDRLESQKAK